MLQWLLLLLCFQIYFYASYVFKESGIPADKIQYVTIGTGACEFTACIVCVSAVTPVKKQTVYLLGMALRSLRSEECKSLKLPSPFSHVAH